MKENNFCSSNTHFSPRALDGSYSTIWRRKSVDEKRAWRTLERVKKLEQSDIIQSYHAMVNPQMMGLNVKTFVLVSLAWKKENALNNFLEKISQIDEVTECYIITGEADFLMKIVCKDIPTYEQLLFKTISQIEEIERLKTLMTLSTVKDSKILPYNYDEK
jgi:DNA-binding Lrp family transcriptional regulator